jgi:deoxyribodipyrimidine photolyase-related protein
VSTAVYFIFPHQLHEKNSLLQQHEWPVYLVEEYLFFSQYHFHRAKLIFHRASMKAYAEQLKQHVVHYIEAHQPDADVRVLIPQLAQQGIKEIHCIDPVDDWLMRRMQSACANNKITLHVIESPLFLNRAANLLAGFFAPHKKSFFQTTFYKQQRVDFNILMEADGQPKGGQWTYDIDNRKKYPKGKTVVETIFPEPTSYWNEASNYVQTHFPDAPGAVQFVYPHTHTAAAAWLKQFLTRRFYDFGIYEDALVQGEMVLHHSVLTPMLNVGLISPQTILQETVTWSKTYDVPLNSLEGFIRQIIGWREFMRGVYIAKGREQRTKNFWQFTRPMPSSFYTATTGIDPVDDVIRKVLKTGYAHHIERLMVLGNFMLLCEIEPKSVYRWFMELFIDAYDWVMVPNVYGMSQFADGGILSTKPYISGSNYITKMSDYKKGPWQEIWDALFWRFLNKHREVFLRNPRMGMLIRTYDKWPDEKRNAVHTTAENFLQQLH